MGAQAESERILLLPKSIGKGPRHSNSSGSLKGLVSKVTGAASSAGVLRVLAAFGVSGGWMFVSSLLILINKHILKDLNFGWVPYQAPPGARRSWCHALSPVSIDHIRTIVHDTCHDTASDNTAPESSPAHSSTGNRVGPSPVPLGVLAAGTTGSW